MKSIFKIVFLLVVVVSFSSCVSRKDVQLFQGISNTSSNYYSDDKVKIKPDDRLSIKVFSNNQEAASPFNPMIVSRSGAISGGGDQSSIEYLVSREGKIIFPVLGEIKVVDYTINELSDFLQAQIRPYLSEPVVMVRIQNFQINIIGAINGVIEVDDDQINLSQALSQVGGISNQGKLNDILVIREKDGLRTSHRLDLTDSEVLNSPYYYLEQNDIIYIEPTTPARQQRGYLGTVSSYIGIVSSVLSLIVIFTR